MKLAIYGGSFDPPHIGHIRLALETKEYISADKLLIIPTYMPPHKQLSENSPSAEERLKLCELSFAGIGEVSDIETSRGGTSYSWQTVSALREIYPDSELYLIIGADMLLTFDMWKRADYLAENTVLVAAARHEGELNALHEKAAELENTLGAKCIIIENDVLEISSTQLREMLPYGKGEQFIEERTYARIVKNALYSAKPSLEWLREKSYAYLKPKRIAHVAGCEQTAVKLAGIWGADTDTAARAAILHDITKKQSFQEQLQLCEKYDIINCNAELESPEILHAKTGAAFAKDLFGISDEICSAIRWHTTGRPAMTTLEKIVFLADTIEPGRSFPGVDELRRLSEINLDMAVGQCLKRTVEYLRSSGNPVFEDTLNAMNYYYKERNKC